MRVLPPHPLLKFVRLVFFNEARVFSFPLIFRFGSFFLYSHPAAQPDSGKQFFF